MTLEEFLRVPYLLQSTAVADGDGRWLRRVEYPELAGCVAADPNLLAALDALDRHRIRTIVRMLQAGDRPALPRAPATDRHPRAELGRLGMADLLPILDLDEREFAQGGPREKEDT